MMRCIAPAAMALVLVTPLVLVTALGCGRGRDPETVSSTATADPETTAAAPAVSPEPNDSRPAEPERPPHLHAGAPHAAEPAFCADESANPVVALVDDQIRIPLDRVLAIVGDQERRFVPAGGDITEASRAEFLKRNRLRVLNGLVDQQRYYLESVSLDIEITEEEFKTQLHDLLDKESAAQVRQVIARHRDGEITREERDALIARIEDDGIRDLTERMSLTRADFEEQVRRALRVSRMMNEMVYAEVEPTTAEMVHFYNMHKSTLALTKNRADIYRVQVHANEERTLEEARARTDQLREDILARLEGVEGEDRVKIFVPFIREHSDGPNARGGGYVVIYGTEAIGTLEQSTIDMSYASNPYEISPVFPIHNGYSFLMVKQIWPRIQTTFEEIRDTIRAQLYKEKYDARTEEFHAELRAKYPVEICEGNLYLGLTADETDASGSRG